MTENEIGAYKIIARCSKTRAKASEFVLYHGTVKLPTFMPVATRAAMKGIPCDKLEHEIILSNTFHCRHITKDLHDFMSYKKNMLTDSGGFQIVSLKGATVTEEGVLFPDYTKSDDTKIMLSPEQSIQIQNTLGADIIMQLDDVLNPLESKEKLEAGMERSLRWLDRCFKAHKNERQILFPIVQGGLYEDLRIKSIKGILKHKLQGVAIGGLSGGEDKSEFSKIVSYCTKNLPENIPKYVMGIGYPEDIIVCIALGADMSDCVYPTRTARFGRAMTDKKDINLTKQIFSNDERKIDEFCECFTCKNHTRQYIYHIKGTTNFCQLITVHNLYYMKNLTLRIRQSIIDDCFDKFIITWMKNRFEIIPEWIVNVFTEFNIIFN
ncbi:Queuine tRNA-ribosyltransferase catalytic subunit 1 [Conglomerata obtusa]